MCVGSVLWGVWKALLFTELLCWSLSLDILRKFFYHCLWCEYRTSLIFMLYDAVRSLSGLFCFSLKADIQKQRPHQSIPYIFLPRLHWYSSCSQTQSVPQCYCWVMTASSSRHDICILSLVITHHIHIQGGFYTRHVKQLPLHINHKTVNVFNVTALYANLIFPLIWAYRIYVLYSSRYRSFQTSYKNKSQSSP